MTSSSRESLTCFEDLSHETLYEIFEFLDFYQIYESFSQLNNRYDNLINYSTFPAKINIPPMSISTFQYNYYKHIIISHQHQLYFIHLTNPFICDLLFSPLYTRSQFPRLNTLILENIESKYLDNLLRHLSSLSNFSSLTITLVDYIQNLNILYNLIFRLPVLRYCKVSFQQGYLTVPLSISQHQYSPIKYFVIDSACHLEDLNVLLSYLPQLHHLSCNYLLTSRDHQIYQQPIVLNHLTHLSLTTKYISFDQLELFLSNLVHQLQVFHLLSDYDSRYLVANRWQRLILSHMPKLRIFDIQLLPEYDSNQFSFLVSINQFLSSFWSERQWFFRYDYEDSLAAFYSITPDRRKEYKLYNYLYQNTYPCQNKINIHSINHISIQGNIKRENNCIYFFNVTELTLLDHTNQSLHSIATILDRIIPLTKLNKLSICCRYFHISQLIELLYFSPNINQLIINSISFSKITSILIQQSQTFQTILNQNKITNLIFKEDSTLETIQLFYKLCPRLNQLTIDLLRYDYLTVTNFLKDNLFSHHVPLLCFLNANGMFPDIIQSYMPKECSMKLISNSLYVWM